LTYVSIRQAITTIKVNTFITPQDFIKPQYHLSLPLYHLPRTLLVPYELVYLMEYGIIQDAALSVWVSFIQHDYLGFSHTVAWICGACLGTAEQYQL
jgi:hypothetical protein